MDRAAKLPKLEDEEMESKYGYVYAVSGPGMLNFNQIFCYLNSCKLTIKKEIFFHGKNF